jgi:hypothetical protein
LKEFEAVGCGGNQISIGTYGERIEFKYGTGGDCNFSTHTIDEAMEIHQQFGQVIATARRLEAKNRK